MAELFELNPEYSTTRLVTSEVPTIEEPPDAAFNTVLFLLEGEGRKGEGGLRTQGYFKYSLPEKPLITVITVVFNGAKYLEETILSVISQSYDNIEYIVIDGGSTDGTLDIIHKYEHTIDYWVSEKDEGIYYAMNKGITLSLGESIGIINSDDWYEPNVLDEISRNTDLSIKIFHGDMKLYKNNLYYYTTFFDTFESINKGMIISHPTLFVGMYIYKKYGIFKEKYKIAADWEFVLRLYNANCNFLYTKKILANFRIGGASSHINLESVLEKSAIRRSHNIFFLIDKFLLCDFIKLFLFNRYVNKLYLVKQKFLMSFINR